MPDHALNDRTRRVTAFRASLTRRIDAPVDAVFALLADVHAWPTWGPFARSAARHLDRPGVVPHPVRLGRHDLRVLVTSPDAPYWLRYRLTAGPFRARHSAEVTLSPTDDGGTELSWRATMTHVVPGIGRRRTAALTAEVSRLSAQLASAAEDAPTTRVEWAARADSSRHLDPPVPARSVHELAA
jgi:uncharacterized protein YndB with AHSA1/START domain